MVLCWGNHCVFISEPDRQAVKKVVTEVELRALEDILAHVASQTTKEEQEYIAEENIQNQVRSWFKSSIDVLLFIEIFKNSSTFLLLSKSLWKFSLRAVWVACFFAGPEGPYWPSEEVFSDGGNSERNKSIAGLNKISLQTLQCVELAVWSWLTIPVLGGER